MASPGLFTSVQFFDPANPMSIVWVVGVMVLAVVVSFVTTLLLGFEDIPVDAPRTAQSKQSDAVPPASLAVKTP
jgi:PTS system arbutin/cellobiose/salicin-specific IIC component